MRKKEQRRGGTACPDVVGDPPASFFESTSVFTLPPWAVEFFFEKQHIMLIKLFTIPVGDSGGALQEMNAFLRLLNGWTSIRNAAPIT